MSVLCVSFLICTCFFNDCVESISSCSIFSIILNVGKHRIAICCTGEAVKINFTGFILPVLIQREKCNIFPVLYRKDSKDCTFYLCVIIHGKGDGVMCLVYFTFTVGCTGSAVTWCTSALIKFVAHNKSSVLILSFKEDSMHDIKDILTDIRKNSN